MHKLKLFLATLLVAQGCFAATWTLDNDESMLFFSSSKTATASPAPIIEQHQFEDLSGTVDEKGNAIFKIDLNSVDTRIPIRDDRMKEKLFQTDTFQDAIFTTQIDLNALNEINSEVKNVPLKGQLDLHGMQKTITTEVTIRKIDDKTVEVTNTKPILVNATDFNLSNGIDELKGLAFLQNISVEVPVNFELVFVRNP